MCASGVAGLCVMCVGVVVVFGCFVGVEVGPGWMGQQRGELWIGQRLEEYLSGVLHSLFQGSLAFALGVTPARYAHTQYMKLLRVLRKSARLGLTKPGQQVPVPEP